MPRRVQPSIVHRLATVILIRLTSIVLPPAFMTSRSTVASPRRTSPAIMRRLEAMAEHAQIVVDAVLVPCQQLEASLLDSQGDIIIVSPANKPCT